MDFPVSLKRIAYFFILLPLFGKSQCLQIIDDRIENMGYIINLVEDYMGLKMEKSNSPYEKYVTYKNQKGFCSFIAKVKPHHHIAKDSIFTYYTVESVRIYGPGERIDSLFSYLKMQGKSCSGYETQEQYVIYNNQWFKHSNHHQEKEDFILPLKEIYIEKLIL